MKLLSLLLKLGDMPSGGLALHHPQSVHSLTILPNHAGPGHLDLPVELGIWIDVKAAKDSRLVPQSLKARTGSGQMGVASRIGPVPGRGMCPGVLSASVGQCYLQPCYYCHQKKWAFPKSNTCGGCVL